MGQEAVQQDLGATTASCPLSALPRAGGDVGGARPWSSENGESRARVFLTGISVVGRKEFHFPVLQGRGGVQGSSVHHRTINRTSTTSKMTKRTMIAHHCRRSGRERNGRSSYFNRRKAGGELFLHCASLQKESSLTSRTSTVPFCRLLPTACGVTALLFQDAAAFWDCRVEF